jgi:hypothetical protein
MMEGNLASLDRPLAENASAFVYHCQVPLCLTPAGPKNRDDEFIQIMLKKLTVS